MISNELMIGRFATTGKHTIERVSLSRVDLFQNLHGQWFSIQYNIDRKTAERYGFDLNNNDVIKVFQGII